MYTILVVVALMSWNSVSTSTQQVGQFSNAEICAKVAASLALDKNMVIQYNDNAPKSVKEVVSARCVPLNEVRNLNIPN